MSNSDIKLPFAQAVSLAEKIKHAISPACLRLSFAGSLRRKKAYLGDLEFLAIPRLVTAPGYHQLSMLNDPPPMVSALDFCLLEMCKQKPNFRNAGKDGDKYKKFEVEITPGVWFGVDIFITTPEQWGYILALRTGPDAFNKEWVTQQCKGGILPDTMHFSGGWLYNYGQRVDTPDEKQFFEAIGLGWIEPENRNPQAINNLVRA